MHAYYRLFYITNSQLFANRDSPFERGRTLGAITRPLLSFVYKRLENVTERNAMFVHFLAWDKRYIGHFFEALLTGVFDMAFYLQHVILVVPPQVILGDPSNRSFGR